MRILILLGSPGHLRLFQPIIEQLQSKNLEIDIVFLDSKISDDKKESYKNILKNSNITPITFESVFPSKKTLLYKIYALVYNAAGVFFHIEEFKHNSSVGNRAQRKVGYSNILLSTGFLFLRLFLSKETLFSHIEIILRNLAVRFNEYAQGNEILSGYKAIIVSPLIEFNCDQSLILNFAPQNTKIIFMVHSWDNLTSKAKIVNQLSAVYVWNLDQALEAINFHAISPSKIRTVGAYGYDKWFQLRQNLPPSSNLIKSRFALFLASSNFIVGDKEVELVQLLASVISRDLTIVVRPHPQNFKIWNEVKISNVHVTHSELPIFESESLFYWNLIKDCEFVIGVNTSALWEASIANKMALIINFSEFRNGQDLTNHFRYFREAPNTIICENIGAFSDGIDTIYSLSDEKRMELCQQTVLKIIRPRGLSIISTHTAVQEILKDLDKEEIPLDSKSNNLVLRNVILLVISLTYSLDRVLDPVNIVIKHLNLNSSRLIVKLNDFLERQSNRILFGKFKSNNLKAMKKVFKIKLITRLFKK